MMQSKRHRTHSESGHLWRDKWTALSGLLSHGLGEGICCPLTVRTAQDAGAGVQDLEIRVAG